MQGGFRGLKDRMREVDLLSMGLDFRSIFCHKCDMLWGLECGLGDVDKCMAIFASRLDIWVSVVIAPIITPYCKDVCDTQYCSKLTHIERNKQKLRCFIHVTRKALLESIGTAPRSCCELVKSIRDLFGQYIPDDSDVNKILSPCRSIKELSNIASENAKAIEISVLANDNVPIIISPDNRQPSFFYAEGS